MLDLWSRMPQTKNILIPVVIAIIIIVVIGIGLYFVLSSVWKEKPEVVPEEVVPEEILPMAPPVERHEFQGMKYEIIGQVNTVYDVITGQLTEEQVKTLAEKIIGDIVAKNLDVEEITLLFYSDLIAAGIGECDVAQIDWTPEEVNVKMIE